jgi:hypothetical protein
MSDRSIRSTTAPAAAAERLTLSDAKLNDFVVLDPFEDGAVRSAGVLVNGLADQRHIERIEAHVQTNSGVDFCATVGSIRSGGEKGAALPRFRYQADYTNGRRDATGNDEHKAQLLTRKLAVLRAHCVN